MLNFSSYSTMLSLQTDMCFPFEYEFYIRNNLFNNGNLVVDLGCGNASYLNALSKSFPNACFQGYDTSIELIKAANLRAHNLHIEVGTIENIIDSPDILILRLVMHQIEDRINFITKIKNKLITGNKVVIIDPFDENFILTPELPNFINRLIALREVLSPNKNGRNVYKLIEQEMHQAEFQLISKNDYYIPSLLPDYKHKYYEYMLATGKMLGDIKEELNDEITNWYNNSKSYAQIGIRMFLFEKL